MYYPTLICTKLFISDIGMFAKMMVDGYDETALEHGHKDIYKEL